MIELHGGVLFARTCQDKLVGSDKAGVEGSYDVNQSDDKLLGVPRRSRSFITKHTNL